MNEEITQVQHTVLDEDTETYDENIPMDGTSPATSLPLCEAIDEMGDLLDTEQVPDADVQFHINVARNIYQIEDNNDDLDMDIADHIDQPEDDNNDFSVDAIGLDGATPSVTNLLIHGIIDEAGDMPMAPVHDNFERE